MKSQFKNALLLFSVVIISHSAVAQGKVQIKTTSPSPAASFEQEFGSAIVKVSYSRPLVRGRKIFGELIPFDKIWRTGASDCTTLSSTEEIIIAGKTLSAGKYSVFTIPNESEWTVIFNKDTTLHGDSGYDEKKDVFRIKIKPQRTPSLYETFTIEINDINSRGEGTLKMIWENTMLAIPIKSVADDKLLELISQNVIIKKSQDSNLLFQSANYYYATSRDPKLAIRWLEEAAILDAENYYIRYLQQKIYADDKDYKNAIRSAEAALKIAEVKKANGDIKAMKNRISELKSKS